MKRGMSILRAGSLLKHQIKVCAFTSENDVMHGFWEEDLVAHCGKRT
jgi:hypothetical protein